MGRGDLHIEQGETLVQFRDKVFRIPTSVDLFYTYSNDSVVEAKVRRLARAYGNDFTNFNNYPDCMNCSHTASYRIALESGTSLNVGNIPSLCSYVMGKVDEVLVFSIPGMDFKERLFMAKNQPCAVKDAFYTVLRGHGALDAFYIDKKPGRFPDIRMITPGNDLERRAVSEYESVMKN